MSSVHSLAEVAARLRAEGPTTPEAANAQIRAIRLLQFPYHAGMLAAFVGIGVGIGWFDNDFLAIAGILTIFVCLTFYLRRIGKLGQLRVPLINYADHGYMHAALEEAPELRELFDQWRTELPNGCILLIDQHRLLKALERRSSLTN